MYLFINENLIEPYNGEVLKRYVGNKLVKAISNPTNEDLKEFGYKDLVESKVPTFDSETQTLNIKYKYTDTQIIKTYEVINITNDEEINSGIEEVIE